MTYIKFAHHDCIKIVEAMAEATVEAMVEAMVEVTAMVVAKVGELLVWFESKNLGAKRDLAVCLGPLFFALVKLNSFCKSIME